MTWPQCYSNLTDVLLNGWKCYWLLKSCISKTTSRHYPESTISIIQIISLFIQGSLLKLTIHHDSKNQNEDWKCFYLFLSTVLLEESKNKSHGYVEKSLLIISFHHDSTNQSDVWKCFYLFLSTVFLDESKNKSHGYVENIWLVSWLPVPFPNRLHMLVWMA